MAATQARNRPVFSRLHQAPRLLSLCALRNPHLRILCSCLQMVSWNMKKRELRIMNNAPCARETRAIFTNREPANGPIRTFSLHAHLRPPRTPTEWFQDQFCRRI
jgi:hypothetical protein